MERKPRTFATGRRARLVAAALLLVPCAATAQISAVLELSDELIAAGQQLSVRIIVDHETVADVELPQIAWDRHLQLLSGPVIAPIRLPSAPDERIAIEFELRARIPGRVIIEPIEISVAGQTFITEPRLVEISEPRDLSRVPLGLRWSPATESMRVGQVQPVTLELVNAREYTFPDSVTVQAPAAAILEEVSGLGEIKRRVVDGVELLSIPVAGFMLTAGESGLVELPAATAIADGYEVGSLPFSIEVEPLPDAVLDSGAVGDFEVAAHLSRDRLLAGGSTELIVEITGTGNLHYLDPPEPRSDSIRLDPTERTEELTPARGGYRGTARFVYTAGSPEGGVHTITFDRYDWFDPAANRIRSLQLPSLVLEVEAATVITRVEEPTATLALLDEAGIAEARPVDRYRDPLAYGWFAPGILFFVGAFLLRRHRGASLVLLIAAASLLSAEQPQDATLEEALRLASDGELGASLQLHSRLLQDDPNSPGLLHNIGVIEARRENEARAVFAFREAIRINPSLQAARVALAEVEASAELVIQASPPHRWVPDWFFFGVAGTVNLLLIVVAVMRKRSGTRTIAIILLSILMAASLGGLLATDAGRNRGVAVTAQQISLRRIPETDADGWYLLPAGSALEVVTEQADSVLLRTATRIEGWADRDLLLIQGESTPWFGRPTGM